MIPVAALALGYKDPFHLSDSDLNRIQEYLLAHRSQIRTFFNGDADFLNLYKSGEIVAGFAWHDYRAAAQREGVPAEYVVPTEGQLAWVCGWGIATGAQNMDAAYAALSWYNSPTPQAYYAKSYTYWVFNRKTLSRAAAEADRHHRPRPPGTASARDPAGHPGQLRPLVAGLPDRQES